MQKSKLSSDASFLWDLRSLCRFTIFRFSVDKEKGERGRERRKGLCKSWRGSLLGHGHMTNIQSSPVQSSPGVILTVKAHQHSVPLHLSNIKSIHLMATCIYTHTHTHTHTSS